MVQVTYSWEQAGLDEACKRADVLPPMNGLMQIRRESLRLPEITGFDTNFWLSVFHE
jgi:hypothetical protein